MLLLNPQTNVTLMPTRVNPIAHPCGPRRRGGAPEWGESGPARDWGERGLHRAAGEGASVPHLQPPTRLPHGHPGRAAERGGSVPVFHAAQMPPGKLKTWNPDAFHGLAATRISVFQDSRFSPAPSAPEEGVLAPAPVTRSGRFLHHLIYSIRRAIGGILQCLCG